MPRSWRRPAESRNGSGSARHVVLDIDLRAFGGSALTGDLDVPKDTPLDRIGSSIPATYVPARNTIFLSFALGLGRGARGIRHLPRRQRPGLQRVPGLPAGVHRGLQRMANLATRAGVEGRRLTVHTPLISLSKAEIVALGTRLGVDYGLTWSCYDPGRTAPLAVAARPAF